MRKKKNKKKLNILKDNINNNKKSKTEDEIIKLKK